MLNSAQRYRLLEYLPGLLLWGTLVGALILSLSAPRAAIVLVIAFDFYWLLRVVYFVFHLFLTWRSLEKTQQVDWYAQLRAQCPQWQKIWHVIFLPTAQEGVEVLRSTLQGLLSACYDRQRFIVVLAGEARYAEQFKIKVAALSQEFQNQFGGWLVTLHPADIPGELPGKGSNLNFAGRRAQEFLDAQGLAYQDVLASAFDCDTIAHPQYFAYLTYLFCTLPEPQLRSYQPLALYNNNIWGAPAFVRLAALSTTFWHMTELARPERMWTFSSHSLPFQALVDVGFWETNLVNEDTRIFLQCFLHYHGRYRVTPVHLPVSMDAVEAKGYWQTHRALYRQQRRWAWGVEHIPYLAKHCLRRSDISRRERVRRFWYALEGTHSWSTAPFLIFILGHLPFLAAGEELQGQLLLSSAPWLLKLLMQLAMVGIIASLFLMWRLLPRPTAQVSYRRRLAMILQWLLLPISLFIFSALPAIEAQTRLLLGRYLGFHVTEKNRKAVSYQRGRPRSDYPALVSV